ncbi:hypothetical protein GH714_026784 [Hevea brasiliensis]|uniref:GTP cyclohydrolase 1 n=1 Tax=Hevea brasiliensis TaxID=3981 RepID=A0A6A6KGT9_HEVBR|nr:hypothetical protein GH714_026784 [Hevea brasiliensis]
MGALDEEHFNVELENGVKLDCLELGFEEEPETLAIENAVTVLLQGLGEDINREGLKKTPLRVAKALLHGTKGYKQKAKEIIHSALFPEAGLDNAVGHAGGAGGIVIVRDLDLFSYCESCLLPFQVKCHVGYVPSGQRVVGLSKLSRLLMSLQDDSRIRREWQMKSVPLCTMGSNQQFRGINFDKNQMKDSMEQCWCPSKSSLSAKISSKIEPPNPGMVTAVTSILRSLGEDPLREELVGTPNRFVKWLMNFQNAKLEMKLNGFGCGRIDTLKANGDIG